MLQLKKRKKNEKSISSDTEKLQEMQGAKRELVWWSASRILSSMNVAFLCEVTSPVVQWRAKAIILRKVWRRRSFVSERYLRDREKRKYFRSDEIEGIASSVVSPRLEDGETRLSFYFHLRGERQSAYGLKVGWGFLNLIRRNSINKCSKVP